MSGKLKFGFPATPSRRNGTSSAELRRATSANISPKAVRIVGGGDLRKLHARDDHADVRMACTGEIDDFLQVGRDLRDRHAAKDVVDPEFDDEHIDRLLEEARQTPQTAGGGVAAHAGVHDMERLSAARGLLRKKRRVSLGSFHPVAGGQTVAEH